MSNTLEKATLKKIKRELQHVERLDFQTGSDAEGDPASWIWVIMKTNAPQSAWSWENTQKIKTKILDELRKDGISDWVYVRFRRADEGAPAEFVSTSG